jgi:hypothetical protein
MAERDGEGAAEVLQFLNRAVLRKSLLMKPTRYGQLRCPMGLTRKLQMPSDQSTIRPESEFDISGCVPPI